MAETKKSKSKGPGLNITYSTAAKRIGKHRVKVLAEMEKLFKQIEEATNPEDKTGYQRMIENLQNQLNNNYTAEDELKKMNTFVKDRHETSDDSSEESTDDGVVAGNYVGSRSTPNTSTYSASASPTGETTSLSALPGYGNWDPTDLPDNTPNYASAADVPANAPNIIMIQNIPYQKNEAGTDWEPLGHGISAANVGVYDSWNSFYASPVNHNPGDKITIETKDGTTNLYEMGQVSAGGNVTFKLISSTGDVHGAPVDYKTAGDESGAGDITMPYTMFKRNKGFSYFSPEVTNQSYGGPVPMAQNSNVVTGGGGKISSMDQPDLLDTLRNQWRKIQQKYGGADENIFTGWAREDYDAGTSSDGVFGKGTMYEGMSYKDWRKMQGLGPTFGQAVAGIPGAIGEGIVKGAKAFGQGVNWVNEQIPDDLKYHAARLGIQSTIDRYNMKKGQEPAEAVNYGRLTYDPITGKETSDQIRRQGQTSRYALRDASGALGSQALLAGEQGIASATGTTLGQVDEQLANLNISGRQAVDAANQRVRMLEEVATAQNKAKMDEYYEKGLKGLSEKTVGAMDDYLKMNMAGEAVSDYNLNLLKGTYQPIYSQADYKALYLQSFPNATDDEINKEYKNYIDAKRSGDYDDFLANKRYGGVVSRYKNRFKNI